MGDDWKIMEIIEIKGMMGVNKIGRGDDDDGCW